MAKYLKDVLKGKNTTTKKTNDLGGYKPKAGDEEKFAKDHEIEKHEDRVGNGDSAYMATNIKPVLLRPEEKRHKDAGKVYESKKAEDVSCNQSPAGTKCPIHEMADCSAVKSIKELSTAIIGSYVDKKAAAKGPFMGGKDFKSFSTANKKLSGNAKINATNEERLPHQMDAGELRQHLATHYGHIEHGSYVSPQKHRTYLYHVNRLAKMIGKPTEHVRKQVRKDHGMMDDMHEGKTTGREDLLGKNSLEHHKQLKKSGYVSKGSERTGSGPEHSYYHPKSNTMHVFRAKGGKINHAFEWTPNISYGKAHGAVVHEETVEEGANVDRMVAHVKSSEKAAGKSDKKAESIAWATANKRGMLDNKNKKTNEANAVEPLLQGDSHSNEAAEMAKAELKALANKALHLVMQMPESMHIEPWCQAKIAQAKIMINDVHDYMIYGNHEEDEQVDTPMDITTASNPPNSYPSFSADVNTGRNV